MPWNYRISISLPITLNMHLCVDLGLENLLEGDSISSKLRDAFSQLLNGHLLLVEIEPEKSLV
jgi:hypothetical protein